jgi:endo-1,3(4)-beta-glucanase
VGSRLLGAAIGLGLLQSAAGCGDSSPTTAGSTGSVGGAGPGSTTTSATSSSTSASTTSSSSSGTGGQSALPWTMGAPFSTTAPPFPSSPHPLAPGPLWGQQKAPFPTNAEWENLVLGAGMSVINVLPYVINALDNGFQVSMPARVTGATDASLTIDHDLSFISGELAGQRTIVGFDPLSVTMRWTGGPGKTITAPFVRGMPMATAVYAGLTPLLSTPHKILSVNGAQVSPVTADRFVLALDNGQTWVVYASAPLTFSWSGGVLKASALFDGVIRAAAVGAAADTLAVLDQHRSAYPTGGDVSATVNGNAADLGFAWKKEGAGPLLMMALPHHLDSLVNPTKTDVDLRTIKGDMIGIVGDSWTFFEPLSTITWSAPAGIAADKVADVKAALAVDAAQEKPVAEDAYFFGKQVAKLGRLALIADEVGDTAAAAAVRARMKAALDPWLTGQNKDALRYDPVWGGICTSGGLAAQGAEFGQGWYNDHHFHYGYFLYAAAALGRGDPAWLASRREAITALARDIANPSAADPAFTRFRHKDWFTGHSWAAGLFEFGDSRNQESTSEAVNAWYGLYLYGLAAGDPDLANVGRVLLATEVRSVQKYWHIRAGSPIYDEPFASNKTVGILWSTKAQYATFFCGADECIHGIQMLPFTPITEALLEPAWVAEEYPYVFGKLQPSSGESWRGFIYLDHAVIDPAAAWQQVKTLGSYDDGNTKTNSLYWVASRPK